MPSIVSIALGRHSSSPVVSVKVRQSKISASGSRPCSSQHSSVIRWATSSLRSRRLGHAHLVDRQRDQRGPVGLGQRDDAVELVASGLEVDRVDDRPAGDLLERGLDHLGLGGVDLDRRGLGQADPLDHLTHLLVLVLALGQRDADVEHVGAAGDLVLGDHDQPVVVVGQEHLLGLARALGVDPLADQRRARVLDERGGGDHRAQVGGPALGRCAGRAARDRARRSRAMCSGVVPQQPPTIETP